jgi:fatty acid desaturase
MTMQRAPLTSNDNDRDTNTWRATGRSSQSTLELMRRLLNEVATLFRQELALARAEFMRSISRLATGATAVATGAAVLYAGVLVLLLAAVFGLAAVLEPWLAALIVGLIVGIIGYVMVHAGLKTLSRTSVKPELTADSLKRDKDILTRRDS